MANGSRASHRRSARSRLTQRGYFASRNNGGESLVDNYKEMRNYGATASQAFDFMKVYRQNSTGDYYR